MTNPWSDAAIRKNGIVETPNSRHPQPPSTSSSTSCLLSTLHSVVKVWHLSDALLAITLFMYGHVIRSSHLIVVLVLVFGMATLFMIRAVVGLWSLASSVSVPRNRIGLRCSSSYVTPLLAITNVVLSCSCMGGHGGWLVPYVQTHASTLHLSDAVVQWMTRHHHALWVFFLLTAFVEGIRYWITSTLHQWLLRQDMAVAGRGPIGDDSPPDLLYSYTPRSHSWNQRPWWWSSRSKQRRRRRKRRHNNNYDDMELQDALLGDDDNHHDGRPHWAKQHNDASRNYSMHHDDDDDVPTDTKSFWSRWFGKHNDNNDDNDDNDSVDFASVQEEWASRSEEDPFWWSRDDQQQAQVQASPQRQTCPNTKEEPSSSRDVLGTSWAQDHSAQPLPPRDDNHNDDSSSWARQELGLSSSFNAMTNDKDTL